MIRDVGESVGNAVLDGMGRIAGRTQERRPLPTDILESDDAYLVVFDAPAASSEDVQVRFSEDAVHVRIDRVRDHHEGFEMRAPGRGLALDGQADLPDGAVVDPEAATATLTSTGTLEVRVPKTDEREDEPVRISTGDGTVPENGVESAVERIGDDPVDDT
ncbi:MULTISPECIES: Hsp20/alpha crystallin family protein [Halococcus]|uniref:Putative Hsp20 n=1 Tax=Halococcus salifodinae DSM 8989 TaxID=1227456 RepID=M0N774_9EURY|nr:MULTISPECIES: Hsp20 family protein [Halococcus]EMA53726.1 putative Hsp20 [Halococcus salifodinae DSM 8989]